MMRPKRGQHRVFVAKADKLPYRRKSPIVKGPTEGLNCCNCGWPFKVTSSVLKAGLDAEGNKRFAHALCPSLSERKRLRAEALVQS